MIKKPMAREKNLRIRTIWTPDNWNDGYIDNRGRFRVYRPDCPRAFESGYALRAHVVWWLEHGVDHPKGTNLHHIDENKTNDKIENLKVIGHGEHTRLHHEDISNHVQVECKKCGRKFKTTRTRIKDGRGRYCSRECANKWIRGVNFKKISFMNKSMILSDWSRELGMSYHALRGRMLLGWTPEEMFTVPVSFKNKKRHFSGRS